MRPWWSKWPPPARPRKGQAEALIGLIVGAGGESDAMPAMAEGAENVLPCDSARPIDPDDGIEQGPKGPVKLKTGTGDVEWKEF